MKENTLALGVNISFIISNTNYSFSDLKGRVWYDYIDFIFIFCKK